MTYHFALSSLSDGYSIDCVDLSRLSVVHRLFGVEICLHDTVFIFGYSFGFQIKDVGHLHLNLIQVAGSISLASLSLTVRFQ